jgi:monoamine oxidase
MADDSVVKTYDPEKILTSPVFSHVGHIEGNCRIVHTAGQIAADSEGNIPSNYPDQIRLALSNLDRCLRAAGACKKDIVKLTYYIVNYDPKDRPHVELLTEFLAGHRPCTTLVPVPVLARPEYLFEIEAVAAVPVTARQTAKNISSGGPSSTQVVVIGAGLSGLQAAVDLQKAGISTVVLEARNRVGGKTWSHAARNGKGFAELGAAWINDVNQPRAYGLAKKLGLELIEQHVKGNVAMENYPSFPYGQLPEVPLPVGRSRMS